MPKLFSTILLTWTQRLRELKLSGFPRNSLIHSFILNTSCLVSCKVMELRVELNTD